MVKTIIGGIDVQQYITSYRVDNPPVYVNNSFTDITGVEVQDKLGDKVTLSLTLEDVPNTEALQLAEVLQADSISVSYTTPVPAAGQFKKTAYTADCSDADPDETDYNETDGILWDINVTLESIDYAASGSDSL